MISKLNKLVIFMLLFTTFIMAGDRKVLVEIFTNSHCSLCPSAHSTLDNYLQSSNADKIEFIYYHMSYPYSSDQLYQHNTVDSQAKNSFYGPHSSTPKAYFNGTLVSNSYSSWANSLDELTAVESNFDISLSGSYTADDFTILVSVTQTAAISVSDLTINYVVVEDVNYAGQNGISNHKNVMRKIVNPEGESFSFNLNETINLDATIQNGGWNTDNLKVIVFVQSKTNRQVLQSESIAYSDLTVTAVNEEMTLSNNFNLEQNYPNPFNPTTTIEYTIPAAVDANFAATTKLVIYDILGQEAAILVNQYQKSGNYKIVFDASELSSGIYYYSLITNTNIISRKMILLK